VLRIQVPPVFFAPNVSVLSGLNPDLTVSNDTVMRRIAVMLNRFPNYQIRVEGHANPTAPTPALRDIEHELELIPLSVERGRTVLEYLVTLGVDRNRLASFGLGGSRTVIPYEDRNNWWRNRRVEFILVR
jgi:outer membrane protein OmpA-like peptidoglycan-associated protein